MKTTRLFRATMLALSLSVLAPAAALAQSGDDAAESRAASFEAARGAQAEQVPGGTLLIAAYGAIWLLVLAYVVSVGFRQARIGRDLERLRQDLERRERD